MSKMREAFEKWWVNSRVRIDYSHNAGLSSQAFDAGYQAAIVEWGTGNIVKTYKLPEDV
jgi:hypothetical protein